MLQDRRDDQYGRASNKVVPQVTDVRCSEQNEHQALRKERREKHRGSGNATNKERRQKETEDTAIENGAQNVACFDQVLDQTGERRYADCDQTPRRCQRLRRHYIMMVAGVGAYQRTLKVDGRGGAESIQRCCCC